MPAFLLHDPDYTDLFLPKAPVHEKMLQILPAFKALKVLRFESTDFHVRPRRTFDDDFATARQWATLCPTLVYCCLPLSAFVFV